ncbi:acyl-CoA dehydratase activase [Novisyntrophococcus fermenticellae]|uniref:acyl-CoA dehydratase activase n=1 Tax=Novisyntrophococcus fermenticellae TaxID=2068655 RepID=UPI001E395913|nr:acyl-CoA dehydratase activase [Novisyntrophococcus fermenticellae]
MKGYVGIDCGSAACKGILLNESRILCHSIKPTGWSPRTTAKEAFQMNDKCAAGTGRFLEMSAHRMGLDMDGFAKCLEAGKSCSLNSMCAVFADSEIVSLLAAGKSREEIAGGVVHAVVARTAVLTGKLEMDSPVLLTGGLSDIEGLRSTLEEKLDCSVQTSPWSRYAGAIGAALISMSDSTTPI